MMTHHHLCHVIVTKFNHDLGNLVMMLALWFSHKSFVLHMLLLMSILIKMKSGLNHNQHWHWSNWSHEICNVSCYKWKWPSKETLLFKEFTSFFDIKENVIHAKEQALGGQFCQACGHLVEFTNKGPLYFETYITMRMNVVEWGLFNLLKFKLSLS
jgi:hypothetical protein